MSKVNRIAQYKPIRKAVLIVRKYFCLVMSFILLTLLAGCNALPHEHVYDIETSRTQSTCLEKGQQSLKCNQCDETITEELPLSSHTVLEWEITEQPTIDKWGSQQGICTVCNEMVSKLAAKLGASAYSPLDIDIQKFYKDICSGRFDDYNGLYLRLNGKVTHVSNYEDMIGYYLYGKTGEGVCCWVYSWQTTKQLAKVGDTVTFVGKVQNEGSNHVELVMCELADK